MANSEIANDEAQWQAESDARSLAEAEVIGKDGKRLKAAKKAAKKMAEDQLNNAEAMKDVAGYVTFNYKK